MIICNVITALLCALVQKKAIPVYQIPPFVIYGNISPARPCLALPRHTMPNLATPCLAIENTIHHFLRFVKRFFIFCTGVAEFSDNGNFPVWECALWIIHQ